VSFMENAAALRFIAQSDRIPFAAINYIKNSIVDTNAVIKQIVGEDVGFYHGIGATAAGLSAALDAALAACAEYESAIHDAADFIEQAGS
jgi:hydroxymethylpyrimidine/phosphomethylpyrimidine kinase